MSVDPDEEAPEPVIPGADERIATAILAQLRQRFDAPIGALIGFTEMLLEDAGAADDAGTGASEMVPDLEKMLAAGHRLKQLISTLQEADRAKASTGGPDDDTPGFRRTLRHDLRTPLNAVIGYAELLREDAADRGLESMDSDLRRIVDAAKALLDEIDSLVNFDPAQIGTGQAALEAEVAASLLTEVGSDLATQRPRAFRDRQASILLVDDNANNREVLTRRLERDGHLVTTAAGGREALGLLDQGLPDLILLDLLMPDMNGYEVLQALKGRDGWRDIPVIMVSAFNELVSTIRCIEAGAEDYLPKPVDPVLLRARIGSILERQWLREREQLLVKREIETAIAIQRSLLPPTPEPDSPIWGVNRPYRYVSGDFFDFFVRDDGFIPFALGDVSGKGFDAALLMAKTGGLFRYLAKSMDDPGTIMAILNREFCETATGGRFVTAVVGLFEPESGHLRFANAGHLPPLLVRPEAPCLELDEASPPLGVVPDMEFDTQSITLTSNGSFAVFTDGLAECRNRDGDELGLSGVAKILADGAGRKARRQVKTLLGVLESSGWQIRDDLTLLVLSRR